MAYIRDEGLLSKRVNSDIEYMFGEVDKLNVEDIKTQGMTVRVGNKVLKLGLIEGETLSIEDEIREEFKEKLSEKTKKIRDEINKKINEMRDFVREIKNKADKKKREYDNLMGRVREMPDIDESYAKAGLSVVRGSRSDARSYLWLVQGVYWPKTLNSQQIEPKMSKKMVSNVTFVIKTEGDKVTQVSTRKPIGLDYFPHYHQQSPDCWGKWKYPRTWNTPDDIIRIAREAEAVLENINKGSIATENPQGLPRKTTLLRHLIDNKTKKKIPTKLNMNTIRTGISTDLRADDENVWTT